MGDDIPGFFTSSRVAIVGLGLMGGSLAMALHGKCAGLIGIDPDPETRALANSLNIFEQVSDALNHNLPPADIIILAAPVKTIIRLINDLPHFYPAPAVILDLGSTKVEIMNAMQTLPQRFDPIGGHPMCGKEKSGLVNADSSIFRDAPFAFTPLSRTSSRARQAAETLAHLVGARPLWLDAVDHDHWAAATSHLPYLVSNGLAYSTPFEAAPLVGPGFRSTTRLGASSPEMMLDVLLTNRENILAAWRRLRSHMDTLDEMLDSNDVEGLMALLTQGAAQQRKIVSV
jgi:prephenate dehydrogenase